MEANFPMCCLGLKQTKRFFFTKEEKSEETISQTGEDTVNYASKRELISRLHEELQKLNRRT